MYYEQSFYSRHTELKGSNFLKYRHFFSQVRFNKFIFCINTIINGAIRQTVKFQLAFVFELDQKWYDFFIVSLN